MAELAPLTVGQQLAQGIGSQTVLGLFFGDVQLQ